MTRTICNVHIYREMRLFYPGIEAETHEEAARKDLLEHGHLRIARARVGDGPPECLVTKGAAISVGLCGCAGSSN